MCTDIARLGRQSPTLAPEVGGAAALAEADGAAASFGLRAALQREERRWAQLCSTGD